MESVEEQKLDEATGSNEADPPYAIGNTIVEDTFAEAFGMKYTRLVITAHDTYWLESAVREFTGYSSSVIACDLEAGLERWLTLDETPDCRPGAAILAFGFSADALASAVANRVGQCVMTCASTASSWCRSPWALQVAWPVET